MWYVARPLSRTELPGLLPGIEVALSIGAMLN